MTPPNKPVARDPDKNRDGTQASGRQEALREERRQRQRRGAFSEHLAAAFLMLQGYRILAHRWMSHKGEIDLVAARGRSLVFVEVKRRETFEAAEASITSRQRARVRAAAELWVSTRPRYQAHEIRFDLVFVVPGRWPRHIVGGL